MLSCSRLRRPLPSSNSLAYRRASPVRTSYVEGAAPARHRRPEHDQGFPDGVAERMIPCAARRTRLPPSRIRRIPHTRPALVACRSRSPTPARTARTAADGDHLHARKYHLGAYIDLLRRKVHMSRGECTTRDERYARLERRAVRRRQRRQDAAARPRCRTQPRRQDAGHAQRLFPRATQRTHPQHRGVSLPACVKLRGCAGGEIGIDWQTRAGVGRRAVSPHLL